VLLDLAIWMVSFGLGRLREEFGRSARANTPLGVLMLDIDHFEAVNDRYGHLVGDRALKSICAIARAALREGEGSCVAEARSSWPSFPLRRPMTFGSCAKGFASLREGSNCVRLHPPPMEG